MNFIILSDIWIMLGATYLNKVIQYPSSKKIHHPRGLSILKIILSRHWDFEFISTVDGLFVDPVIRIIKIFSNVLTKCHIYHE